MNPFGAVGSVAIFFLVGSAVVSFVRWLTGALNRAARWWLATLGLVVAGVGTWFVWARGAPAEMLVLGGVVAGGAVLGSAARAQLGSRGVLVATAGLIAEGCALAAWVLWYGTVLQPWARAIAAGLGVAVAVFVVVLILTAVAQVVATGRWLHQELFDRSRSERP